MTKPVTQDYHLLDEWRLNLNKVADNLGDPDSIYTTDGVDTFSHPLVDITTSAINNLNTRKVKRSGDTIAYLGITGDLSIGGTVTTDFDVNTNKFVVLAASGNTSIAGTLAVAGSSILSSTLGVTGATSLSSTLSVVGDLSINTNKFNVISASGNTSIAGTLAVASSMVITGASTLSSTLSVTGATSLSSTLGVVGDLSVNTNKFNVVGLSGNTSIAGTLGVTGNTALSGLSATTGAFSSTLGVTGDFSVNANKFNVAGLTGNTNIAGTLAVIGNINGNLLGNATSATNVQGGMTNSIVYQTGVSTSGFLAMGTAGQALTVNTGGTGYSYLTLQSITAPLMDGVAAAGTAVAMARGDHVHPIDTSRAPLASPTFIGTVTAPAITLTTSNAYSGTGSIVLKNGTSNIIAELAPTGNANKVLGSNAGATGYEFKGFQSSGGSVSITHGVGFINLETAGTLGATTLTGDLNVGSPSKFSVAVATGNTVIAGSLNVATATNLASTLGVSGSVSLSSTLSVVSDLLINTNKFTVAGLTGNTAIAGTLNVSGATTLAGLSATTISSSSSSSLAAATATSLSLPHNDISNATVTTTAVTATTLVSLPIATYRSARFEIQGVDATGAKYHRVEVNAVHNGTVSDSVEYGATALGGLTGTFTVSIVTGNLVLQVTPATTNSTVFKVYTSAMKI